MKGKLLIIFCFFLCFCDNKEIKEIDEKEKAITFAKLTNDYHYNFAFNEIASMLAGEKPLDFKRAVFLQEWAYLKGELDYQDFCLRINDISTKLNKFIQDKGIAGYKTAGNYALFEFFTKPNHLNNQKPFTYDFDDFVGENDYKQTFVTKLLDTHKGQCRSLPVLYKILAEEISADAYLALAPNHLYIKHLGEDNKWVNVELTNGHFASDAFIISSMGISAEAIRNRIYMDALDLKQSVAFCLTELSFGYQKLYGYDIFVVECCNRTLKEFPNSIPTLLQKYNALRDIAIKYINQHGKQPSNFLDSNYADFQNTRNLIESFGFREMPAEKYEAWLKEVEIEKNKQSLNN